MTTPLERPLARELLLGGDPYKVVISPDGLRLTAKGHQKGVEVSWDSILALGQTAATPGGGVAAQRSDLPQAIAADVAREVRAADEALARARSALERAGTLPAALLADVEPDPVHGRPQHDANWFIEPLLTIAEVASILRLSRNAVMQLPGPLGHAGRRASVPPIGAAPLPIDSGERQVKPVPQWGVAPV